MMMDLSDVVKPLNIFDMFHIGVVVDNEDPKKLGRIKCEVEGIFEGIKSELPWVYAESPYGFGASSTTAIFSVPKIGSEVIITFPDKDIYSPCYSGANYNESNKVADFDEGYPNVFGVVNDEFKFTHNTESKETKFTHPSGALVNIKEDGTFTIESKESKIEIGSDGAININGKGNITIDSEAELEAKGKSKSTVGNSGSITNVKGSNVILADGNRPLALFGSQCTGIGNAGYVVTSQIVSQVATKVLAK